MTSESARYYLEKLDSCFPEAGAPPVARIMDLSGPFGIRPESIYAWRTSIGIFISNGKTSLKELRESLQAVIDDKIDDLLVERRKRLTVSRPEPDMPSLEEVQSVEQIASPLLPMTDLTTVKRSACLAARRAARDVFLKAADKARYHGDTQREADVLRCYAMLEEGIESLNRDLESMR